MLKHTLVIGALALALNASAHATDLLQIYQEAQKNDATYQAAAATYSAAKYGMPIALAALLPQVQLTANTQLNSPRPVPADHPANYNSNNYQIQITQPVLNLGAWGLFSESRITVAQAALTFTQAQQQLITDVTTAYFNVLEAQEKLNYAQTNQSSLAQQMNQTEQQYKVGLKALTDVQSTKASYESAIASTVSAQNAVENAYEQLAVLTGKPETNLAILAPDAPLIKPNPNNSENWVNAALQGNLDLQAAQLQAKLNELGITVAKLGDGNAPGYVPTINAVATNSYSRTHGVATGSDPSSVGGRARSAQLNISYSAFNGGSTYYEVKKANYTAQSAEFTLEQTRRNTISNTRQAYLNILSDISQVKAYKQAVISGESSLEAITAAYNVGTRTIVDLLTQQSNLFNSEQQYANARYQYITDSLNLKAQTGLLAPNDVVAINQWLTPATTTTSSSTMPMVKSAS